MFEGGKRRHVNITRTQSGCSGEANHQLYPPQPLGRGAHRSGKADLLTSIQLCREVQGFKGARKQGPLYEEYKHPRLLFTESCQQVCLHCKTETCRAHQCSCTAQVACAPQFEHHALDELLALTLIMGLPLQVLHLLVKGSGTARKASSHTSPSYDHVMGTVGTPQKVSTQNTHQGLAKDDEEQTVTRLLLTFHGGDTGGNLCPEQGETSCAQKNKKESGN